MGNDYTANPPPHTAKKNPPANRTIRVNADERETRGGMFYMIFWGHEAVDPAMGDHVGVCKGFGYPAISITEF